MKQKLEPAGRTLKPSISFGPFELDLGAAELRKHGHKIRLQEQPFLILVELLKRPGEVVSREEIRAKLWPDNISVEFDHSINAAVKRLRDTLRDSAENPRYIETVARRGYRFIGQVRAAGVETVPAAASLEIAGQEKAGGEERRGVRSGLRGRVWMAAGVAAALLSAAFGFWYRRTAPERWVRKEALPEIERLAAKGEYATAFPLLYRSQQILPRDTRLMKIRREISYVVPVRSTPPGASVFLKPYTKPDSPWLYIGQSPMEHLQLPVGYFRWRITKPGFQTLEVAAGLQGPIEFTLDRESSVPEQMVHVPPGNVQMFGQAPVWLADFWIGKYEVTNREFKRFVDAGGYRDRKYWREPFVENGRELAWEEAMARFHDSTGRPGPATWGESLSRGARGISRHWRELV